MFMVCLPQARAAARMTARTMRAWVPQLHRLPASACLDLALARLLVRGQERRRLHDHAVDAVAALRGLLVDECLLHRMRLLGRAETFQRHDVLLASTAESGVTQERTASPSTCTVQAPHCAEPAAEARAVQAKIVAQHVEQRHRRVVVFDRDPLAIHGKRLGFGHGRPPNPRTGIYAARTFASAPVALTPVTGAFLECFRHSPGPRIGVNYSILLGYTEGTVRPMSVPGSLGDLRAQLI